MWSNGPTPTHPEVNPLGVLAICNHPGGANAVVPVVRELSRRGMQPFGITTRHSSQRFAEEGIPHSLVTGPLRVDEATGLICQRAPSVVLLGTSQTADPDVGRLEACFAAAAKRLGVPSIAVLDHWCGYRDRFSLTGEGLLDALPDFICVMDERARQEMAREGFSGEKLVVTGNPHWDHLHKVRQELHGLDRIALRHEMGIGSEDRIVLFVSEPLSKDGHHLARGYSELDVLSDLVAAIGTKDSPTTVVLIIKPHPREKPEKFLPFVETSRRKWIIDDGRTNMFFLGAVSDLVVGISSMLLIEYAMLGFPVVSYQPISDRYRRMDLDYGVKVVHTLAELKGCLKSSPMSVVRGNYQYASTQQVIDVVRWCLDIPAVGSEKRR